MARTLVASDPFTYAAGILSTVGTASWLELDNSGGRCEVISNDVHNPFSAISECRHKSTFSVDQYAEITFGGTIAGSSDTAGVGLRASTGTVGSRSLYRIYWHQGTGLIFERVDAGTPTQLGATDTTQTFAAGDKLSAEVTGVGATVTINAYRTPSAGSLTLITSRSDTDANRKTTGNPCVLARSSVDTLRITDWAGGDITAGGASVAPIAQAHYRRRRMT